jgi:hypothetical protein
MAAGEIVFRTHVAVMAAEAELAASPRTAAEAAKYRIISSPLPQKIGRSTGLHNRKSICDLPEQPRERRGYYRALQPIATKILGSAKFLGRHVSERFRSIYPLPHPTWRNKNRRSAEERPD